MHRSESTTAVPNYLELVAQLHDLLHGLFKAADVLQLQHTRLPLPLPQAPCVM